MNNLTFSQANGYEELPEPLKLEDLPEDARTRIWNALYWFMRYSVFGHSVDGDWHDILLEVHLNHYVLPLDQWDQSFEYHRSRLREAIKWSEFNEVFDLIQFVLRHAQCPEDLIDAMKRAFADSRLAYAIDKGPPPTIIPAATEEEGRAIIESSELLRHAGLGGSEAHLRRASEFINASDWASSIRESISAVESVARQLDPNESGTLTRALASLEKRQALHPAFKEALAKLYGYTSDEQGVRHALLDQSSANVGKDEAVLMLGACASFASYLWRKYEV